MKDVDNADGVLARLLEGNERFFNGLRSVRTIATPEQLFKLSENGQNPSCVVLTCSDSRMPAEMIFDQGLGDLFVIRVAGNVVAPSLVASIEFALTSFGCPLVLVLGHTKCGAIRAACDHYQNPHSTGSANLDDLVGRINPAVEKCFVSDISAQQLRDRVTMANVRHSIAEILRSSQIVAERNERGEVKVVGGVFELETGRVVLDERAGAQMVKPLAKWSKLEAGS